MATDGFVKVFAIPVLLVFVALIVVAVKSRSNPLGPQPFNRLETRRISFGLLGALFALLAYSLIFSVLHGLERSVPPDASAGGLFESFFVWAIYYFFVLAPFVLVGLTLIALPLMYILSRFRLASVFSAIAVACVFAALNAWGTHLSPGNSWCESNMSACVSSAFFKSLPLAVTVALGFSLAAGLPAFRDNSRET